VLVVVRPLQVSLMKAINRQAMIMKRVMVRRFWCPCSQLSVLATPCGAVCTLSPVLVFCPAAGLRSCYALLRLCYALRLCYTLLSGGAGH